MTKDILSEKMIATGLALLILTVILTPHSLWAGEWRITPSLELKETYNDNILYSSSDAFKKDDWITTVSPGLDVARVTEKLDVGLKGRFDGIYYADNHDLNAWDSSVNGRFRYTIKEGLGIRAGAAYTRDSQIDREIETTGLVLSPIKRERQNYSAGGDWRFTEKTSAALSYQYEKNRYEGDRYLDMWSQGVDLDFVRNMEGFLKNTKGRLNFGYASYHYDIEDINNYSATIGFSRDIHELWSLLIDLGARYTESRFTFISQTNDAWGVVGQVALAYKGEKTSGQLTIAKDIMPASGINGAADRTSANFDIQYRLTYGLQAFLTASYFINKADKGQYSTVGIDERTMTVRPGLRYEFNKDIALDAAYTYNRTDYRISHTDVDRNLFLMRLTLQHELLQ